jgi:hypothetical protein
VAKGGQTTTQSTALDPQSQRHVEFLRQYARGGADALGGGGPLFLGADPRSIEQQMAPFLNPYTDNIRSEYDHLRAGASTATSDAATRAGAFGGSRHGVAEGVRLGEIDRAQAGHMSGLFQNAMSQGLQYSEYQRSLAERQAQEPMFRAMQQLQMMGLGMGPTGMTQSTTTPSPSFGGQLLGLGLTGAGMFMGGPAGAAAGSALAGGGGVGGGLFGGGGNLPGLGMQPYLPRGY